MESFCPHDGHLPLVGFITSFRDFNIFIFVIFSPHLPHVISTDMKIIRYTKLLRNGFDFFNKSNKLFYCFSIIIPRSSKPVILALVPTGKSAGVAIPAINPEIRKFVLSNWSTTKAYGVYFSNPAGATVIIV